ncbi:MAG: serine/threonine protein kinase [Oscillatoriales cyanobacterium]|uniref:non-specific serine/threonine protein kinase n=1 Tax=Microcoleus anatoxicus PTRS2 TaxID=2705321 RepID=A0ABU8YS65_9CYAN|nr:MAG: serine/threonine protein kinase [Oscillatoriales cyanobacterium]TAD98846.1 MAG: serine/threonine protein kinase [Oscillatoriales cyanobacterium]TAE06864.1 MAG: serine/threonine protein kinase [Oscillatoriales cyanobacterium]TAF05027.1 MAG: serine/threonine protein kinase [Oscillatoriales cyanobacterium]TAF66718.1 MAG: serine/threonine protein kinase [Oscillatoriales cyanobacterium]
MEVYCTRPGCPRPQNYFPDLDDSSLLKTVQQRYCKTCGMPLILSGRYLPVRLLGQGGFGAAFLARDRYTPAMRQCVAKLLQPSVSLTPAQLTIAQNLFEREAAVLEELGNEHPQIPSLLAFFELTVPSLQAGKTDQFFYLVQEFIDGENLEQELAVKGKFSESETVEVLRGILKVLDFVHSRGSIHRDIKPANIMRGKNGRLYLLDFGAVKQVTQSAGSAKASTGIYSLGYAPPEQMNGQEVYPATDLYALGVTCITLLSGLQPTELFDSYRNEWNWHSRVQINSRLAQVLDRMLLSAPSQRFQSVAQVEAALKSGPPQQHSQQSTVVVAPPPLGTPQPPGIAPQPLAPTLIPGTAPGGLQPAPRGSFSIWEVLSGAAFTGFEGGLLAIALTSLLPSPGLSMGLLGLILGGLIYGQYRRTLEVTEMLTIGAGTLALLVFFPALRSAATVIYPGATIMGVLFVGWLGALGAIAATAIFRLIYRLLSHLF